MLFLDDRYPLARASAVGASSRCGASSSPPDAAGTFVLPTVPVVTPGAPEPAPA